MKKNTTPITATLFGILLAVVVGGFAIYGWVENIIKLVHTVNFNAEIGMTIVRIIGIFVAPLGVVLGYF